MPSSPSSSNSSLGGLGLDTRLAQVTIGGINLRTLSFLNSTMNLIFPDYDFADIEPVHFSKNLKIDSVVNLVKITLMSIGISKSSSEMNEICRVIWDTIDQVVGMNDCEIYSFEPNDPEDRIDDPFHNNSM
jgi:hypothetical protein